MAENAYHNVFLFSPGKYGGYLYGARKKPQAGVGCFAQIGALFLVPGVVISLSSTSTAPMTLWSGLGFVVGGVLFLLSVLPPFVQQRRETQFYEHGQVVVAQLLHWEKTRGGERENKPSVYSLRLEFVSPETGEVVAREMKVRCRYAPPPVGASVALLWVNSRLVRLM
ncbi:MAG: hypothetical protein SF029_23145 [bacterium]|nr:hypothetical protein [bacterium]